MMILIIILIIRIKGLARRLYFIIERGPENQFLIYKMRIDK